MDNFGDLIEAVQSDLTVGSTSSFYDPATIKSKLNRSRIKAEGLFRWPALQDAKKTSTETGIDYYDAPETWRPHSAWRLVVDGEQYGEEPDGSPLTFPDYLVFKQEEPDSTAKKWALQWLRYFISPTPTSNGNNNIEIWGQKNGSWLTADGDTTIFSYSLPDCNEAIVLEAVAMLKRKGTEVSQSDQFLSLEAKAILTTAWNKIRQEEMKKEKAKPVFNVPDFFRGRGKTPQNTGDFDL